MKIRNVVPASKIKLHHLRHGVFECSPTLLSTVIDFGPDVDLLREAITDASEGPSYMGEPNRIDFSDLTSVEVLIVWCSWYTDNPEGAMKDLARNYAAKH